VEDLAANSSQGGYQISTRLMLNDGGKKEIGYERLLNDYLKSRGDNYAK